MISTTQVLAVNRKFSTANKQTNKQWHISGASWPNAFILRMLSRWSDFHTVQKGIIPYNPLSIFCPFYSLRWKATGLNNYFHILNAAHIFTLNKYLSIWMKKTTAFCFIISQKVTQGSAQFYVLSEIWYKMFFLNHVKSSSVL